jgi:hypothetical protein
VSPIPPNTFVAVFLVSSLSINSTSQNLKGHISSEFYQYDIMATSLPFSEADLSAGAERLLDIGCL